MSGCGDGGIEVDGDGNSVVHRYAMGEVSELDEGVLTNFLALNGKNAAGETPLHLAAKHGRVDICQTLLQNGANPLERNNKNRTPRSQIKIDPEIKALLLDAEEAFKAQKRDRDARLWDEKMQKTQTESAFGLRVV